MKQIRIDKKKIMEIGRYTLFLLMLLLGIPTLVLIYTYFASYFIPTTLNYGSIFYGGIASTAISIVLLGWLFERALKKEKKDEPKN